MRPHVVCHMITSIDGRLHPGRWTRSPDGTRQQWSATYEAIHETLRPDAWLIGRVTMAEMAKAPPHPPEERGPISRPLHRADPAATGHAVALDPSGKLHFETGSLGDDHVVVLLGRDVGDAYLAELVADGVSYLVSENAEMDLAAMLDTLGREFGIRRLLLEGGGSVNGSFVAAGLVDELSLLVAPAVDGGTRSQSIVAFGEAGLAGMVGLSFVGCEPREHGLVHLRYRVEPVVERTAAPRRYDGEGNQS